ncbi:MAG: hypothetical protein GY820_06140 [Gammaproteobacteria bacterium]|nr:hypothetical protein [Gammaproteobacteria bacterium]
MWQSWLNKRMEIIEGSEHIQRKVTSSKHKKKATTNKRNWHHKKILKLEKEYRQYGKGSDNFYLIGLTNLALTVLNTLQKMQNGSISEKNDQLIESKAAFIEAHTITSIVNTNLADYPINKEHFMTEYDLNNDDIKNNQLCECYVSP